MKYERMQTSKLWHAKKHKRAVLRDKEHPIPMIDSDNLDQTKLEFVRKVEQDIERIEWPYKCPDSFKLHLRDKALASLFFLSGCRVSEVLGRKGRVMRWKVKGVAKEKFLPPMEGMRKSEFKCYNN